MTAAPQRLSTRAWALAGAFLFLLLFFAYLKSSPADLYLDDSGETVTVAASLGIGHPPGYPLASMLEHLAGRLPWAGSAWRVNLMAVLWGALSATLLGLWGLRQALLSRLKPLAALAAAALLALLLAQGPVFWHNALGAKGSLYQLNNLLSLLLLACLVLPASAERRSLRLFWLLFGLSLAHHYMSQAPLLPAYAWLLWRRQRGLRTILRDAWLALPGLALYLYLPLRWAQHPALAWGSFANWQEFWFYFFRLQYAAGEVTRSVQTSWAQGVHALGLILREGAGVLSALAAFGFWAHRKEDVPQALGLGLLAALGAVTLYLNLPAERLDLMQPYLFPAYLCQAGLAAYGSGTLLERLGAPMNAALAGLALSAALLAGAHAWPSLSLQGYYFASDNARSLLQALPPRAILLAQGDAIIFPLWHQQRVLHARPDVAVIGLAVLPMQWVRDDLTRMHPELRSPTVSGPIGAESVGRLTQAYIEMNQDRPIYAAFNRFDPPIPGWQLESEGLVWRVTRSAQNSPPQREAALRRLDAASQRGFTRRPLDARTLKLIVGDRAICYNSLGVAAEDTAPQEALRYYSLAERLDPANPDYPFNRGNTLHELRRLDEARDAFLKAVTLDARYTNGWYNLGVTAYELGQMPQAKSAFRQVLAQDPKRAGVQALLARLGP